MKKIIALLLAVVMVACLFAGCQGGDGEETNPSTNSTTDEATDPATEPAGDETEPAADCQGRIHRGHAFVTDVGNIDDLPSTSIPMKA